MSMRGVVSSLLRQQSHSTRRSFVVASAQQQQRVGNPMVDRGGSSAAPLVPPRPAMANVVVVNSVCCGQQRAELSTLRRGVTGPLSARVRLPMRGLEEFRDPEIIKTGDVPIVGRSWTVPELRNKSFEDLHKLWFVLYKEKNMLMTELAISRRSKAPLPAGDRRKKVKQSMKAIRVVVGERQRVKRAIIRERQLAAKREKREALKAAAAEEGAASNVDGAVGSETATSFSNP